MARAQIDRVLDASDALAPDLDALAERRAADLHASHTRVRTATRVRTRTAVRAFLPPDVLGVYVYLPALAAAGDRVPARHPAAG